MLLLVNLWFYTAANVGYIYIYGCVHTSHYTDNLPDYLQRDEEIGPPIPLCKRFDSNLLHD